MRQRFGFGFRFARRIFAVASGTVSAWILAGGFWRDQGEWDDASVWED